MSINAFPVAVIPEEPISHFVVEDPNDPPVAFTTPLTDNAVPSQRT